QPDLQPARRPRRAHLHLRQVGARHLPRRPERPLPRQPRGDALRLPLPRERGAARPADLAHPRHPGAVLMRRSPSSLALGAALPGPAGGGAFPAGGARTTVGSQLCDEASPNTWTLAAGPIAAGQSAVVQPTADMLKTAFLTDLFPDQFGHLHGGFDLGEPFVL